MSAGPHTPVSPGRVPRRSVLCGVPAVLLALAQGRVLAQRAPYPARDVQIVVPNEPGGGLDLVARLFARGLGHATGKPFHVINRSGGSGNVGTASVARAEADGHTLLLTGVGHVVSPLLHDRPGYEPKDFEPVARLASAPNVLLVHEALKGMTLQQLLADARSRNSGWAYGSAGYGQSSHLAAEVFMARTGARWLHVPYRGTAPGSRALLAGEVQLMFVPAGSVQPLLASGSAHAVAVAAARRLNSLPGVPTLSELGVRGADFGQWYGVLAPAGTPEAALEALQAELGKQLADAETVRGLQAMGIEPAWLGRGDFAAFLAAQGSELASFVQRNRVEGTRN